MCQPHSSVGSLTWATWTGGLGTQKGVTTSSEDGMLEETSSDNDGNSYYLLCASCGPGAVLSAHHPMSPIPHNNPLQEGLLLFLFYRRVKVASLRSHRWKAQGQV